MFVGKQKLQRLGAGCAIVLVCYAGYNFVDKYCNKASAEENLQKHVSILYANKTPDALTCANVDTGNYDSRVSCEVRFGEDVKVYLCKGIFDNFDSSCITPKFVAKH